MYGCIITFGVQLGITYFNCIRRDFSEADNALVLAIMVKHLPEEKRKKALFYGLAGAFIFRFGSLFIISFLVDVWQVQALGAIYLMFIAGNHLFKTYMRKHTNEETKKKDANIKKKTRKLLVDGI